MRTKTGNGHNAELEKFIDDLKTVVHDGEELIKTGALGIKQRAVAGAKSTDEVVREHPYQSIGIMFGVGLFLGMLAYGLLTRESEMDEF
jgi:ElaB/YqjD/DUF883 family membrane-anchored ribosome-binding protein